MTELDGSFLIDFNHFKDIRDILQHNSVKVYLILRFCIENKEVLWQNLRKNQIFSEICYDLFMHTL